MSSLVLEREIRALSDAVSSLKERDDQQSAVIEQLLTVTGSSTSPSPNDDPTSTQVSSQLASLPPSLPLALPSPLAPSLPPPALVRLSSSKELELLAMHAQISAFNEQVHADHCCCYLVVWYVVVHPQM